LPLWAQLDRDASGPGDWQAGIAATYPLSPDDNIGVELTRTTPHDDYQQSDIGAGYIHAIGKTHYRGYAAYGWFLGPANNGTP